VLLGGCRDGYCAIANAGIERGHHSKYKRYGPKIVGMVVDAAVAPLTIRLMPLN
jgi:hypothetical protein